jgi:hypothetical protein
MGAKKKTSASTEKAEYMHTTALQDKISIADCAPSTISFEAFSVFDFLSEVKAGEKQGDERYAPAADPNLCHSLALARSSSHPTVPGALPSAASLSIPGRARVRTRQRQRQPSDACLPRVL